jgi:hypothetical protein
MTGLALTIENSLAWRQETTCPAGWLGVGLMINIGETNIIQRQNLESAGRKQGRKHMTRTIQLDNWNVKWPPGKEREVIKVMKSIIFK